MKKTYIFMLITVLLVGCQPSESIVQTAIAQTQIVTGATATSQISTSTVVPTSTNVPTATPEFLQYYTEDFEVDNKSWSYFFLDGNSYNMRDGIGTAALIDIQDGFLNFEFTVKRAYAYAYYNRFTYKDVRVDTKVSNLGGNDNFLTAICRYAPEAGWYEADVSSGGLYWIYAAKINNNHVDYYKLADGGINSLKQGKDDNILSFVCKEKSLSISVNGKMIKEVIDNQSYFSEGYSGVSASSANHLPVNVKFDWVEISQP